MKEHAKKPVWRTAAGCMAAVMALSTLPWMPLTVRAEEEPKVLYENALDSMDGLVLCGENDSQAEIVQDGERTVLKMHGDEGQAFLIDENANAPASGIIRFDMKLTEVKNVEGGLSSKGGLLFGAGEPSAAGPGEYMWFGVQDGSQIRIRHNEPSQDIMAGGEHVKVGEWQTWQLEYGADQLKILVDDQVQYEGKTPGGAQTLEGNAGFTAWSSYETSFDNLQILEVNTVQPSPEPTEAPKFHYENPLDSKDGLVHIAVNNPAEGQQQWDIVEMDGRTVLQMKGGVGNPGNMYIVDTNANLPAEAVMEFDMKLSWADNGFGGQSSKGGFLFGAALNEEKTALTNETWFAAQDITKIRVRETGAGDMMLDTRNIKAGIWQHWRVEYSASGLAVYVDGKEEYKGALPSGGVPKAGLAGFVAWSEFDTCVDNFVVDEYEPLPPIDTGDDEDLSNAQWIENDTLKVALDKTFPQALRYQLVENDEVIYAGYTNAKHEAYITDDTSLEGTPYPAEVTSFEAAGDRAEYVLSIPDFHGGLSVRYEFRVEGSELVKEITDISGEGEPYLVSFKLDTPILRIKTTQQGAAVAHNVELSPDRYQNYQGDQGNDVIGALSGLNVSTNYTDWAFLYTEKALGTAYNTLFDVPYIVKTMDNGGNKEEALYDREYYYRLAYQPNEDKDGVKQLGEMQRIDTGEPFESRVYICADINGNGKVDWQDGANWVRKQLPELNENLQEFFAKGGTWQQGHGTFPFNRTSSEVKIPYDVWASEARKTYYLTDGTPQAYAIAGWQQHGHDWHWGNWMQNFSPAAGGNEGAKQAMEDTLKYGSYISYHMNQEIDTPESGTYDTNMVARDANGNEQMYNNIFGQERFRNKSYFLDWAAGNTDERMDSFFSNSKYWTPAVLYNDQMWDNTSPYNGVYGVHESFAKKKIIEKYDQYGISICHEGFQPTMVRNGATQWKYNNNNSLVSQYVMAGRGTSQMASPGTYFQIFGEKVSSDARNGNITSVGDFDRAIEDHYLYAAPTFFLRQFEPLEYIDNDEMQAVRWSGDVMSKYLKATDSIEFTQNGVVVVQGNNRFLPDLETPESKIHLYSVSGMAQEWQLPVSWEGVTQVDQYELTSNGQVYVGRLEVKDGKVAPVCSAKVPYILVRAEGEQPELGAVNMALDATSSQPAATDGNVETGWTANGKTGSIEVDLGREREINRVEIVEDGDNIRGFRIEVEKDGEWQTVAEGERVNGEKQLVFPAALGNKVRLTITQAVQEPIVNELRIYADANLSLTAKPVASSSTNYNTVHPDDEGVDVTYSHRGDAYSAADDSLQTMWKATGTENQTLDMEFNRPTKVNRVVVREEGDNITSFKLQGQKDGVWTDLYSGETIGELAEINFFTFTADKVRLLIESAKEAPSILEFAVYGVDEVNEAAIAQGNLALNKPAEQSSTYTASFFPANASLAVDGNTNPDWSAASISATEEEVGAWWQVDLKDTYEIGAIKLFARNACQDRISDIDVIIMDENNTVVWSTHLKDAPNLSVLLNVEQEDGSPVKGRYVKILHPDSIGPRMLEIAECEVYESSEEIGKVDKSALQDLYDDCVKYEEDRYTPESWAVFEAALKYAKEVLDDPDATEVDVNKASQDLFYARERIKEKEGDKTKLEALIAQAETEASKTDVYTPESLEVLKKAIERAKADLETVSTITDVEQAMARLQEGLDQLEKLPVPTSTPSPTTTPEPTATPAPTTAPQPSPDASATPAPTQAPDVTDPQLPATGDGMPVAAVGLLCVLSAVAVPVAMRRKKRCNE
ncbi:hypothetical protein B5F36_13815 [Anaerofilum sp. An201]|nr:discoidin domain-containing protein [Anaerofilum sp. An201]OUP00470.1 hypothetical protein B5F36_13815 [Anaerofilum sp. An201]